MSYQIKKRTLVHKGSCLSVYQDQIENDKNQIHYYDYIQHNGAVGIVVEHNNKYALVKQFRHGINQDTLEIVAGKIDPKEDKILAAKRELQEETGIIAQEIIPLGKIHPIPAYCSEVVYGYYAKNLQFSKQNLDDDEDLEVIWYDQQTLQKMIDNNEITDVKTIIFLIKYWNIKNK